MKKETASTMVRVKPSLRVKLRKLAFNKNMSISDFIEFLLKFYKDNK